MLQDSWLYHLTVAAGGGTGNVGTQYEQLIAKLMQVEGDNSMSVCQSELTSDFKYSCLPNMEHLDMF